MSYVKTLEKNGEKEEAKREEKKNLENTSENTNLSFHNGPPCLSFPTNGYYTLISQQMRFELQDMVIQVADT